MTGYEVLIRIGYNCVILVFLFDCGAESLVVTEAEQCRVANIPISTLCASLSFSLRSCQDLADRFFLTSFPPCLGHASIPELVFVFCFLMV